MERVKSERERMKVVTEFERSQGRSPQNVSGENHGFDIRSTLYDADGSFC
jgi:hypothetical protein